MTNVAIESELREHNSDIAVHSSEIADLKTTVAKLGEKFDKLVFLALGTLATAFGALVVQIVGLLHHP